MSTNRWTVRNDQARLDVLVKNAGDLNAPDPVMQDGRDVRFVVNAIAPYLLTQ